jgi:valyl-tRNA synthetase
MILMTTYAINDIPFQDIYLQGLVTDEKGKKMSKSKGNVINPLDMVEKYGADATRLSLVIGSTPGNDIKLSEEKIEGFRNLINKIWNIARYIKQKTEDKNIKDLKIENKDLSNADLWILNKFNRLSESVSNDLDNYNFSGAGEKLKDFTWNNLADWYLEATKFKNSDQSDKILLNILNELLKLWHPFIPFVTEKIWKEFNANDLIIEKWPNKKTSPDIEDNDKIQIFDLSLEIIKAIRNARSENKVEPNRKIKAIIFAKNKSKELKENAILIQKLKTGIDEIIIKENGEKPEKAIFVPLSNKVEIYLLGAIDEEKEKKRLEKSASQIEERIKILEKKLNNKDFSEKAPEKIVSAEKKKLNELMAEKKKIDEQLKNI